MKLIIASNNKSKIEELRTILGGHFDQIVSLKESGIDHETVEDGTTFMENAIKKAREITEISGCCAIADDSGICVDALNGAPGIYSARFSGIHGDDAANNALLLEKMKNEDNRAAHFTCAVALTYPDGRTVTAEGYMYGEIAREERGSGGFGYDPLFYVPEYGKTNDELGTEMKNRISHRAKALAALLEKLDNA